MASPRRAGGSASGALKPDDIRAERPARVSCRLLDRLMLLRKHHRTNRDGNAATNVANVARLTKSDFFHALDDSSSLTKFAHRARFFSVWHCGAISWFLPKRATLSYFISRLCYFTFSPPPLVARLSRI
jgi:hypothetical protein